MEVKPPGKLASARIFGGFVWLAIDVGGRQIQRRIPVIPEPKTIPRAYRGWCFKQTGPREIEITPSISMKQKGKLIFDTPYRWRVEVTGKIPQAIEPEVELPKWLDVAVTADRIQRTFIDRT